MDLGVRPQPQLLWGEDFGPETNVDHPDLPPVSRPVKGFEELMKKKRLENEQKNWLKTLPWSYAEAVRNPANKQPKQSPKKESSQEDVVDGSSDSDEEWNYVRGATKSPQPDIKSPDNKTEQNDNEDMESQLNPDAAEFVPGAPSPDSDPVIASSPNLDNKTCKDLDDIIVPSEKEFDLEAASRPSELEPATEEDLFNSSTLVAIEKNDTDVHLQSDKEKLDGVTLILSSPTVNGHAETDDKVSNNPFDCEVEDVMEIKSDETDHVNFVQDHFGSNGLSFKPFEPVTPQNINEKGFAETDFTESHMPTSVSAEISSHFNFIDSHLENSDVSPCQEEIKTEAPKETCLSFGNELNFDDIVKSKSEFSENRAYECEALSPVPESVRNNPFEIPDEKEELKESTLDQVQEFGDILSQIVEPLSNDTRTEELSKSLNEMTIDDQLEEHSVTEEGEIEEQNTQIEVLPEESFKEHSQLEIKEHESPIMSQSFCTEIEDVHQTLSEDFMEENKIKEDSLQKEDNHIVDLDPHPEEVSHDELLDSSPAELGEVNTNTVEDMITEASSEYFMLDSHKENANEEIVNEKKEEEQKVAELNQEITNDTVSDVPTVECITQERSFFSDDENEVVCKAPVEDIIVNHVEETLQEEQPLVESHYELQEEKENLIPNAFELQEEKENINYNTHEFQEEIKHVNYNTHEFQEEKENINFVEEAAIPALCVSNSELEVNLEPDAFSFSQEIITTGQTVQSILQDVPKNDIMTTSMHESLDHDSSFEFIDENAAREAIRATAPTADILVESELKIDAPIVGATDELIPQLPEHTENEIQEDILVNGIHHVENSTPDIMSPVEDSKPAVEEKVSEDVPKDAPEAAAVNDTDIVFIEKICPTVEVTSEETSPVDTEVKELLPTAAVVSAAAITSVAAGAAAVVSASTKKESPKKTDAKPAAGAKASPKIVGKASPSPATTKKPASPAAKLTTAKAPVTKSPAPAKPTSPVTAKAKVPASSLAAKKPLATPAKPKSPVAPTSKVAPATKPAVKSTVSAVSKAPLKVATATTTKPLAEAAKPATKPISSITKTAPIAAKPTSASKPAASKVTSAAPKAPIAAKKPITSAPTKPSVTSSTTSRPSSASKTLTSAKPAVPKTTVPASKPAVPKVAGSVLNKPPISKPAVSATTTAKPKAAAPTKPAPIKAKAPIAPPKKIGAAPPKKPSTNLDKNDKNSKNAVKAVTKRNPIENGTVESKDEPEPVSSTTNDLPVENGNISPLVELPPQII